RGHARASEAGTCRKATRRRNSRTALEAGCDPAFGQIQSYVWVGTFSASPNPARLRAMEARLPSQLDTRATRVNANDDDEGPATAEEGILNVRHLKDRLTANAARVVIRPFHLSAGGAASPRTRRIVNDVLSLSPEACEAELRLVNHDFQNRHWQTRDVFL